MGIAPTEVIRPPTDRTVFFDHSAIFSCEVNGGLATWRVNGTYYNSLSPEIRNDVYVFQEDGAGGHEILKLTIPGKAKYNGTKVQCVAGEFGRDPVESLNATMKVQGVLYIYCFILTYLVKCGSLL